APRAARGVARRVAPSRRAPGRDAAGGRVDGAERAGRAGGRMARPRPRLPHGQLRGGRGAAPARDRREPLERRRAVPPRLPRPAGGRDRADAARAPAADRRAREARRRRRRPDARDAHPADAARARRPAGDLRRMRFAVDTGGTFTDLVVEDDDGVLHLFKSPTRPDDPVRGVLDVLDVAAGELGDDLLARGAVFVHATTRAINAVLTGTTARTAFLTTGGHPDVLLFREGGRTDPFNFTRPYPQPYLPRSLTFEVPERIDAEGEVVEPLDEEAVVSICSRLRELGVEAVGVCLLWSIANPAHEQRVGELLEEHLPGVPYTLSHRLNPSIREYRRASSTCIDASLKPVMSEYLRSLEGRLRDAGFAGRVL